MKAFPSKNIHFLDQGYLPINIDHEHLLHEKIHSNLGAVHGGKKIESLPNEQQARIFYGQVMEAPTTKASAMDTARATIPTATFPSLSFSSTENFLVNNSNTK